MGSERKTPRKYCMEEERTVQSSEFFKVSKWIQTILSLS